MGAVGSPGPFSKGQEGPMLKRREGFQHSERRGQDVVEFALILPVLVLLLLGIIEFGMLFYHYNTVALAARDGARAGVVPSAGDAQVYGAAFKAGIGLQLKSENITVRWTRDTVQVTVWYDHHFLTAPIIEAIGGNPVIRIQTTATMRRE